MTDVTINQPAAKRRRQMAREPNCDGPGTACEVVDEVVKGSASSAPPKPPSKSAQVLGLLHRPEGATLGQLVEATGWLPHTTRAVLTGLRKKGHAITKDKLDGATRYTIVAAQSE